jgi:hypothetical protein
VVQAGIQPHRHAPTRDLRVGHQRALTAPDRIRRARAG